MAASADVYQSTRLARGYAYDRPPVHPKIIAQLREHLQLREPLPRALDIGCGAGLSTAALEPIAACVVGIEPVAPMLQFRAAVTGNSVDHRIHESIAAALLAVVKGAKIVRVHDVTATKEALAIYNAMKNSAAQETNASTSNRN